MIENLIIFFFFSIVCTAILLLIKLRKEIQKQRKFYKFSPKECRLYPGDGKMLRRLQAKARIDYPHKSEEWYIAKALHELHSRKRNRFH